MRWPSLAVSASGRKGNNGREDGDEPRNKASSSGRFSTSPGRPPDALLICAIGAGSSRFACVKRSTFVDWVRIEIIGAR